MGVEGLESPQRMRGPFTNTSSHETELKYVAYRTHSKILILSLALVKSNYLFISSKVS